MGGACGVECGETLCQPRGVGKELLDRQYITGGHPIGDRHPAVPFQYRICGRLITDRVHLREVGMADGGGGPGVGEELLDTVARGCRIQDAKQHGPVEGGVGGEPLLDVPVASQTHLRLVSVGQIRSHGGRVPTLDRCAQVYRRMSVRASGRSTKPSLS